MNSILEMLNPNNKIMVDKTVANKIGILEAIMYSELMEQFSRHRQHANMDVNEFFMCPVEVLQKATTMDEVQQNEIIINLKNLNLIETSMQGIPYKRHFKMVWENDILDELFSEVN